MVTHHLGVADPTDDYETAKRKMNNLLIHAQDICAYFAAPPQRKPMNELDALRLVTESIGRLQSAGPVEGLIGIIRAIERAHGIGEHR